MIALIVLAALAPASEALAARKPCAPAGRDRVVVRTALAVIVARKNDRGGETYRGCYRSVGRWRTLHAGEWDGYGGSAAGAAALGGRFAAVAVFTGDHYNAGVTTIQVVDLRSGARRESLEAGRADGDHGVHQYSVTRLAVSRYGTLGWIAFERTSSPELQEVHESIAAHDAAGTRVLDSAAPESLGGLRFSGRTLSWSHDGQRRSARLGTR